RPAHPRATAGPGGYGAIAGHRGATPVLPRRPGPARPRGPEYVPRSHVPTPPATRPGAPAAGRSSPVGDAADPHQARRATLRFAARRRYAPDRLVRPRPGWRHRP